MQLWHFPLDTAKNSGDRTLQSGVRVRVRARRGGGMEWWVEEKRGRRRGREIEREN